jgi:NAD(P)-dependent dehydrogenase (short-subunit alcohol dehydrogenase family)
VIEPITSIADSDPAAWARNVTINLTGAYNAIRAVLPGMLAGGGGTIVNVSSGAAIRPLEGWSAYCSAKAGLHMLTRAIALETAGKGIRVFGFQPGTTDTDMQVLIRASGVNPVSQIPREKLTPVALPAQSIVYLCTTAADDLNGQEFSLNDAAFRARLGQA